ncbi:MAG: hypothetical protein ACOX3B_03265 [Bacilli bacterium]|jgi:fatty acid desaturase|nr:hypothetical protein [Bacillota bacterium]NLI51918.1 hypothetical protein [Erysipelotrichaceae bacterium]
MKFKKKVIIKLATINILMVLSFFLPLATLRKRLPERGLVINYVSGFNMFASPLWPFILPYFIPLLIFIATSFFYFKSKKVRVINFIMLLIMIILGAIAISIFYGYGTLYNIAFLICVVLMITLLVNFKKEEVIQSEITDKQN